MILECRDRRNHLLHEFVLMPNHLHLILTPAESVSLEKTIQLIKGGSSHETHGVPGNKMQIWQSGFQESRLTDWQDYKKRVDYVRFHPVIAKLVDQPQHRIYGSASGKYPLDPIPQGLKPPNSEPLNFRAKAPTLAVTRTQIKSPRLKLRPSKEQIA